jgi:hypothetical protein
MTRLVTGFFAAVAFLLVVYWVVPGAAPPKMEAAAPTIVPMAPPGPSRTVAVATPAIKAAMVPDQPLQPVVLPPAPPPASVARASACGDDPIRCMLEGRPLAADPTEVTGSIVPARAVLKSGTKAHGKAPAKP